MIVIGGGVIGASVAYYLSKKKIGVLLLERSDFASGTSGACDGMIFMQSKKPGLHLALALKSRRIFEDLPEKLGSDIELRRNGGMIIFRSDLELKAMAPFMEEQKRGNLGVSLLDLHQARELEPCLGPNIAAATFCPLDAQVNPLCLTYAFLKAAKRHGAKLFARTPVTGFHVKGNRIYAVVTPQNVVATRSVVNAAGVFASQVGDLLSLTIPVAPRRGQLLVTEVLPPILTRCLLSARYIAAKYDPALAEGQNPGFSIEQTGNGNFLLGSTREFVGFDKRTTRDAIRTILMEVTPILPRLKEAHLIRTFAGLRPYTPDGLPILGKVSTPEGFIMAAGHEGDGIALSPITGQLIAELIADGKTSISLEPFSLERFIPKEPS